MKAPSSALFSDISSTEFFGCYLVALTSCVCCASIAKRYYRTAPLNYQLELRQKWTSDEILTFTLHNALAGVWAVVLLKRYERPTPLNILQVIAFDMAYALWDMAHIFLRRYMDAGQLMDRVVHHVAAIVIVMELFYLPFDPDTLCSLSASVNLSGACVGILRLLFRWEPVAKQAAIQSILWAAIAGTLLSTRIVFPAYTLAPIFLTRWFTLPRSVEFSQYHTFLGYTLIDWDSFLRDCFLYAVGVILVLNGVYICTCVSRSVRPFHKPSLRVESK